MPGRRRDWLTELAQWSTEVVAVGQAKLGAKVQALEAVSVRETGTDQSRAFLEYRPRGKEWFT